MTDFREYPSSATLVAIDIAKQTFDVLVKPATRKRYRLRITNDRLGHNELIANLNGIGAPVVACFEATGNYIGRLLGACWT